MVYRAAIAMLEPSGPPLAILTDFRHFIIVALHHQHEHTSLLVSPSLSQDQLSPSLISLAVYAYIRSPDRPLPLSEDSRAKVEDAMSQNTSKDSTVGEARSSEVVLEREEGANPRDSLAHATHSAFKAGGGLASIEELKQAAEITVFVSPELAGDSASAGWPSLDDSPTLQDYSVYTHTLRRHSYSAYPTPPPSPDAPSYEPSSSPSRPSSPRPSPPSPFTYPLLPIKPDPKRGHHGRCYFGRTLDGTMVALKYGAKHEIRDEARNYTEQLSKLDGLRVPKLYGVFEGTMFDEEEMVLVLEYGGEAFENFDKLSRDQKWQIYGTLRQLHHHGFDHGSFYPRNVVVADPSSPNSEPMLIDFGRTEKHQCSIENGCWELREARDELGLFSMADLF